ncbi:MAG: DNA cytosine methyltransferase [Methanobacteriaceae archaeon]|nr:DNA cytosine methyltransferase [Methanobacteriaceae archaeon]
MVNVIELFAGAGGLALGLEQAGLKHKLLVEIDKDCVSTLKNNRPHWNIIHDDVKNVKFSKYHNVDVVTGGFPCQAFSYAGKRLGFEDTRGTLFFEFARAVKEINPKICIAENVQGLVRHDKGRTIETMINVLKSLGYQVQYQVLNASEYGVAQKRKRLILVGTKNVTFNYPKKQAKIPTIKDALKNVPKSKGVKYSATKEKVLDLVPPGGCWVDLPEDIKKDYMGKSYFSGGGKRGMARRMSWDEPCLTLTTSPCQKQTERCHPDETRPFTIREYARIQSFPDDWIFSGGLTSQYKQIGNAVPVLLAKEIGKQIIKALNEPKQHKHLIQTTLPI